jgi:hypothetical protein
MCREQCISLGLALLAACSSGPSKDAAPADSNRVAAATAPAPTDTSCPATGLWARCSVIRGIYRAGLNPHADAAKEVAEPPLSIPGFELPLARGTVRFFVYADSDSRKRDEAKLDTSLFVSPRHDPSQRKRTLISAGNMLVLMDVMNTRNRERIANAMMAGAPQPPSKTP